MIGHTISHYKILEKLGSGGMGAVYKAEDLKLNRMVALKFLPTSEMEKEADRTRFTHEAQATAALDDSNICPVYEIDEAGGQIFIVMAYVEGKSLKEMIEDERLNIEEVVDIAIQVAEGLNAAHEKGIVHRDIKPANILLNEKGQVRITDFGLAKLPGRTQVTKEGTTLGTISYMSPEQARGETVDYRSDIWSFGVMLYEMVTSQLPFRGEYDQAVVYSIMNEEPEPPTALRSGVPMELERIIFKAMAKEPGDRYQHLDDMMVDLRSLREGSGSVHTAVPPPLRRHRLKRRTYFLTALMILLVLVTFTTIYLYKKADNQINSIAVLPFDNPGNDPELAYLCEGISENLTSSLSRLSGLKVISSSSVRRFRGAALDLKNIARELKVRALVVGKLIYPGKTLSIRVELVDMRDQRQLWGQEYTREFTEILQIQKDMVSKISEQLLLQITSEEQTQLNKQHTENPLAYQSYLKGLYHWNRFTRDDLIKAVGFFNQAIQIDSNYALAYVGLTNAYGLLGSHHGDLPSEEMRAKAQEAALKALELDQTLGEAHTALAFVRFFHDWNWAAAEEAFLKGIQLSPNSAIAHGHYALLLDALGRPHEAVARRKIALELDPLSLKFLDDQALTYMDLGQDEEAFKLWKTVLEMDSTFAPPRRGVGRVFLKRGNFSAAIREFRKGVKFSGRQHMYLGFLGWALAQADQKQAAREILKDLTQDAQDSEIKSYSIAMVHAGLGNHNLAIQWLEKAYAAHRTEMIFLKIDPIFYPLKSDPRYRELLSKMRLSV